jgi:hypothetical protein
MNKKYTMLIQIDTGGSPPAGLSANAIGFRNVSLLLR